MERIENKIEKRNNKKNVQKKVLMVAGLALLLGFVGYTGGTTYAKYVASTEVKTTTATVAKWGYTISADATNIFGEDYYADTIADNDVSVLTAGSTLTVSADSTNGNRVAPSATGSFDLHVNGNAEVLSELKVDFKLNSDVHLDDYYPVKWSVSGNATVGTTDLMPTKDSGLKTSELETFLDSLARPVAANTLVDIDLVLTWSWAFHVDKATDDKDTILGNVASNADFYADPKPYTNISTKLSFELKASVEQLAE